MHTTLTHDRPHKAWNLLALGKCRGGERDNERGGERKIEGKRLRDKKKEKEKERKREQERKTPAVNEYFSVVISSEEDVYSSKRSKLRVR